MFPASGNVKRLDIRLCSSFSFFSLVSCQHSGTDFGLCVCVCFIQYNALMLSFAHWTDMEFGEQFTAPMLLVTASPQSSSSLATPTATLRELSLEERGATGGSLHPSCSKTKSLIIPMKGP